MFVKNDISFSLNKSSTQNQRNSNNSKKKLIFSSEYEINNNDQLIVPENDKNVNINFSKISTNSVIKNSILNLNPKTDIMISNHKFKNIGNFKLKNIIIFTRVYTLNCAINFKKYFETFGITTNIKIDSIDNTDIINCYNDDNLFLLLIGAQYLFRESKTKIEDLIPLPRNKYFIYEIEQLSQEFNLNLMKQFNYLISEPFFEFNYSILNFDYYNSISKTVITPLIDETNIGMINLDKEIDILFVGNVSPHRTRIIDSIKERGYNISVVNRKVGNELFEIVKKSKIIINIHYYNDSVFEVFRIHDFLAFDCNIISEPPENEKEKYLINVYKDIVDFYYSQEEMFNVIESNLHKKPDMVVRKNFIKSMNSKNKALINFNILGSILIKKYSNLFHKYFLQISNPNKNIKYNVKNYKPIVDKSILCHLHCSNISNFNTVYGKYINNLKNYFIIFITYTNGVIEEEILNSFTIIQVPEYGMNIGPKFSFLDFIERIYDLNYSHILFLHDAFDLDNLNKYFEIIDEKYLPFTLNSIHEDKDGIFPDLLTGINSESKDMLLNKIYIEEILNYLNINNKPNYFVKGDCMVLSKRIVNRVFLDNKNLFYNILNNKNNNSFDLNWVRWYYKINQNLENTYNLYKNNKLFGNNLSNTFTNSIDINNFDINTLSSKPFTGNKYSHSMIENVFEKIYLTVIDSFEGGTYITTGTEKKRIEEEKRRKEEEERRIKKERLERVSQLENSLNLVIEKIYTMEYENSERHRKIVFDIDNQEKEIEISKNNSLNNHNNNKIKTIETINNDREKELSKKNQIYSETLNDIKLTNEEINSENLKNDNEITRIDREKDTLEEMCKQIDKEIENEKKMEIERQENEKNRIKQEKLNEIERRKKEAEWIEQEKINEIERRKKEKIRIKNEKELEIKKRSDFEKNIRLQRKLEKERRISEDNRFLKEEALEIDRIPLEDKRIEKLKIEALKKKRLEDERLDNLEKDQQTTILSEKKRIDKRKSDEEIDRPKRKKSIDELYLQQSKKYKEKINIINLKAEQKNKELKNIEEEIKNLNTLCNDKFKAEEERLDKILENINIDYQNKLNHIELLKSKEAEEEKIQNNILLEKKEPLLLEKNNIDIELSKLKNLLDETYQKVDIENYIKQNLSSETLFYKYKLGLAYPKDKINYEVIQNNTSIEFKQRKYYAHLHCFDISRFNEIYGQYIDKISQYFSLVITYSIGLNTVDKNTGYVILKIPNKGMDIGAKFCAVAYLNDNKISHEYILFLHSKSNPETRRKYFEPLINNLSDRFIENINQNDGYFPDIEWEILGDRLKMISGNPEFADSNLPERNLLYRNELLKYLEANNNTNHFIEGNCYILSRNVIDKLYSDSNLYNILNNETSFDYNWVNKAYNIEGNIYEVYKQFVERKLAPRNRNSYDGYLEHVFERVVLNFCNNYKILKVTENREKTITKDNEINVIGLKNINVSIRDNLFLFKNYFNTLYNNSKINIYDISEIKKINYNINTIFCIQPFEIRNLLPYLTYLKNKSQVLWVWEFKSLPQIFKDYEKYFSKVYVQSQFCYDVFSKHLSIPVEKIELKSMIHEYIDMIPNNIINNPRINNILENIKDKTIYGFCFDLNSSILRKNPLNLVRAFNNINDETKVLILKYRPPRGNSFINKIENDIYNSFIIEVKKNKNIYCITEELEALDLYKLYTNFDYYISPHCGEGFGITIYDNMVLGNKIISPYYSGETDYLNREDIIELEYEEKEITGLREHPVYGQMKDFKGAYISVESIENSLNNKIGDEIYILGNGPSLKNCDFNFLKNKTTFALNSSYKKFVELDFYPTYFGCFDPKLIECHYDKFVQLMNHNNKIKKFFFLNENNKGQKQFSFQDENKYRYQKINFLPPQETYINTSSFNKFYKMHNSGATAALISILLGYKKIILLGCDGNYVEQLPETRLIDASTKTLQILKTPEKNPNYWFDNYQEKGEIYSLPDGNNCHMKGWELLYQASKIHNIKIINENPESKIRYFRRSPKISFYYKRRTNPNLKNSGINTICEYIFDNLSHYLDYNIIDDYKESSDIVISTYDELDDNYSRCRIIIVYDLIYLYNKEKTDNQEQFNKIHSILSSLKKNDFIIFNSEFQRRKYLENKDKYDFKVSKDNTDVLYLPYRFEKNKTPEKLTQKYDFFVLIQTTSARKNPELYEKYIEKLKNFKFCVIISNQQRKKIEDYKKVYQYKNNVELFYNCDDKKFYDLISQSKYCLYLTDDEGTGLHAIECLYNNCIPIVKNNIVFNEILGNNCHYITNIYDINNSIIEINNIIKQNKNILDLNSDIFKKFKIDFFCKHFKKIIYNFYSI
jgi:hypothetical protein